MARRSPMNERYGKHTAPSGKTRKSAAAAKPKRSSASTPAKPSQPSGSRKPAAKREPMAYNPDTPEYKKWRKIWWICLGTAFVSTGISFFVMPPRGPSQTIGSLLLGLGYTAIAAALYIDFTKLRKLRAEWIKSGKAAEAGKTAEKVREEKAAEKAAAKESQQAAAEAESSDKSES